MEKKLERSNNFFKFIFKKYNNDSMNILIHLGYPKVMSKFFQVEIFNNLQNVNYLNPNGNIYLLYHEIRDLVFNSSDTDFEVKLIKTQNKIKKYLDNNMLNIFSDEIYFWPNSEGYKNIMERLNKIFQIDELNIQYLILTRDQPTLLKSMYSENQEMFLNLNNNYNTYEKMIEEYFVKDNKTKKENIFFDCLKFKNVIENLKIDTKNLVYTFTYEELTRNDEEKIQQLSKVFETDFDILNKLLKKKPFHVTPKNEKFYLIKNNKIVSLFSHLPFGQFVKSVLPLKFKFYLKNLIYKYSSKKVLIEKSFDTHIKEHYQRNNKDIN